MSGTKACARVEPSTRCGFQGRPPAAELHRTGFDKQEERYAFDEALESQVIVILSVKHY